MPTQTRPSPPTRQPDYVMKPQNPMQTMQTHQTHQTRNQNQNFNNAKKPAPIQSAP